MNKCRSSYKKLIFFFLRKIKLYEKKRLKKEKSINNENIIICVFSLIIIDRSFTGKKPPDEIIVKAKFNESNVLIEKMFKIININIVNDEYKINIFTACFKTSELLKDI